MAKRSHNKKPAAMRNIALERIKELFKQADLRCNKKPLKPYDIGLSNRYITLARKISMKYKVQIPRDLKRRFCKHCYKYLRPGMNCRVRQHKGRTIYYCLNCKKFMRFVRK